MCIRESHRDYVRGLTEEEAVRFITKREWEPRGCGVRVRADGSGLFSCFPYGFGGGGYVPPETCEKCGGRLKWVPFGWPFSGASYQTCPECYSNSLIEQAWDTLGELFDGRRL